MCSLGINNWVSSFPAHHNHMSCHQVDVFWRHRCLRSERINRMCCSLRLNQCALIKYTPHQLCHVLCTAPAGWRRQGSGLSLEITSRLTQWTDQTDKVVSKNRQGDKRQRQMRWWAAKTDQEVSRKDRQGGELQRQTRWWAEKVVSRLWSETRSRLMGWYTSYWDCSESRALLQELSLRQRGQITNKGVISHHSHFLWATLSTCWNAYWLQNLVSCVQLHKWHSPPPPPASAFRN